MKTWALVARLGPPVRGTTGPAVSRLSARISPSSPRSDPTSDDLFAFDGADELRLAWRDGLTPDPALTVSECGRSPTRCLRRTRHGSGGPLHSSETSH
jgi:hypothetical protein